MKYLGTTLDIHPYPPGYKNYSKTRPMRIEEFEPEKAWWGGLERTGRVENEYAWRVSIDDIKARNYNLDIKNPHDPGGESHDPDQLLADYGRLRAEITSTRQALKTILARALQAQVGD